MRNLYDVFSAIAADEADHVSTMTACTDPEANLRSPSMERRALTGIALVAAASYLVTTMGFLDSSLLDTADMAADVATATDGATIAESIAAFTAAGLSSLGQKVAEDEEAANLGRELVEGGAVMTGLEQLRKFGVEIAEFFGRLL